MTAVDGPHPDVRRQRIEMQRRAAVDRHRHLGRQARRERRSGQSLPQWRGERMGVEHVCVGQPGQRIGHHRNAVARLDPERCHLGGEQRRRRRAQAPDLDAAARGDLDDAVAVRSRRRAQAGEGVERDRRSGGRQAGEQAVAGRHRRGESGTGAAAHRYAGRVHAAASARTAARLASMSFRRGCHRPSRRAMSSRSAMARAAAGFSSIRKSRTRASPR